LATNLQGTITENIKQKYKGLLASSMKKYQLVDVNDNVYANGDIENVFYDKSGTLTIDFLIPYDADYKTKNKYFKILDDAGLEITSVKTPNITYSYGVGGLQTLKFPITSDAGTIVFEDGDYVKRDEIDESYLTLKTSLIKDIGSAQNLSLLSKKQVDAFINESKEKTNEQLEKVDSELNKNKKSLLEATKKSKADVKTFLDGNSLKVDDELKKLKQPSLGKGFDFVETTNPLVTTNGNLGDIWFNNNTLEIFKCTDATVDVNKWEGSKGTNIAPIEALEWQGSDTIDIWNDFLKDLMDGSKRIKWYYQGDLVLNVKENGTIFTKPSSVYNWTKTYTNPTYWNNDGGGTSVGTNVSNWTDPMDCYACSGVQYHIFGNGGSHYYGYGNYYHYSVLPLTGRGNFFGITRDTDTDSFKLEVLDD